MSAFLLVSKIIHYLARLMIYRICEKSSCPIAEMQICLQLQMVRRDRGRHSRWRDQRETVEFIFGQWPNCLGLFCLDRFEIYAG